MILMWYKFLGMTFWGPITPQGGASRALLDRQARAQQAPSEPEQIAELSDEDRAREASELMVLYLQPSDQDAPDAPIFMKIEAEYSLYVRLLIDGTLILAALVITGFVRM